MSCSRRIWRYIRTALYIAVRELHSTNIPPQGSGRFETTAHEGMRFRSGEQMSTIHRIWRRRDEIVGVNKASDRQSNTAAGDESLVSQVSIVTLADFQFGFV